MEIITQPVIDSPEDFVQFLERRDNQVIQEVQEVAKKTAEIEIALMDFELLYSVMLPEKIKKENLEWFTMHREKKWKEALKKANGDEIKAFSIYDETSS